MVAQARVTPNGLKAQTISLNNRKIHNVRLAGSRMKMGAVLAHNLHQTQSCDNFQRVLGGVQRQVRRTFG